MVHQEDTRILISRTRIDKSVWDKLKAMAQYQNSTREELINVVLKNFVNTYTFKLQRKELNQPS